MEPHGGAVVAVVVRVVIPLFLTRVDAVGAGRVQELLVAVDASHEAAAANEHDRVATCLVAGALTTMTAADIGELHALIVEQEARAQHDAIVPDEHECPSPCGPRPAGWRPRTFSGRRNTTNAQLSELESCHYLESNGDRLRRIRAHWPLRRRGAAQTR